MDSNQNFLKNNDPSSNKSEEIDYKKIFNFFNRNKKFISSFSIIFIFLGYLCSFFPKRVWEGQFQIVLNSEKKNNRSLIFTRPSVSSFFSKVNDLETEVGILRSPSVLMPAFEIALGDNNQVSGNNYEFSKWKKDNLIIELQKNTSILNIFYKDTNKDVILPVLEKMSSTYQEYSGKRKKIVDQNTENYLKKQIKLYKEKSAKSLRKAQEFAIDQDLMYFDFTQKRSVSQRRSVSKDKKNNDDDITSSSFLPQNINIENVRVSAANQIRKIDLQLKKIAEFNEFEELQYIGSTIPALNSEEEDDLPRTLQQIDAELVEARTKYTEEDKIIKLLLNKRKLVVDSLKTRAINYLKAKRLESEAVMEAASRPKGVLLKYKELIRNSSRDEFTLIELENELRLTELGQFRKEAPWELISKPTLSMEPVDDVRRNIILISFLFGFLISTIYSFYKEKKSGKIFEYTDLKLFKGVELGEILKLNLQLLDEENISFLREFIDKKYNEGINLIKLGDVEENKIQIIKEKFTKNKTKIDVYKSILDFKNSSNSNSNFLILELGSFTSLQFKNFKKYLELFNINFACTIIIEK